MATLVSRLARPLVLPVDDGIRFRPSPFLGSAAGGHESTTRPGALRSCHNTRPIASLPADRLPLPGPRGASVVYHVGTAGCLGGRLCPGHCKIQNQKRWTDRSLRRQEALRRKAGLRVSCGRFALLCGDLGAGGDPSLVPQIRVVFPNLGVEQRGLPEGLLVDHSVHQRV